MADDSSSNAPGSYTGKGWNLVDVRKLRNAPDWIAGPIVAIGILFLVFLFIAAVLLIPILVSDLFSAAFSAKADDVYKILVGLAALLGGPIVIWRAYAAHQQVNISRESHYTSLFTKAVEQLGATGEVKQTVEGLYSPKGVNREAITTTEPNLEVRLGAIYALERIAMDSERDHWPIMEVLSAYIRNPQNCGIPKQAPTDSNKANKDKEFSKWRKSVPPLRVDVQAALSVIGRRSRVRFEYETHRGLRLDFTSANLQRARFRGDYQSANFSGCHLEFSVANESKFDNTNFGSANLHGSMNLRSNYHNADFSFARLQEVRFSKCNAEDCDFFYTELVSAFFSETNLRGARLSYADASGVSFPRANLDFGQFDSTNLRDARLTDASANSADFEDAKLEQARLFGAKLREAKFLTSEQLKTAFGDAETSIPDSCVRPTEWADRALSDVEREEWVRSILKLEEIPF